MRSRLVLTGIALAATMAGAGQQPALCQSSPAVFEKPAAAGEMASLASFAGQPTGSLNAAKPFGKLVNEFVPDCPFHYGIDMPLRRALRADLRGSPEPVRLRAGRYLLLSSAGGRHGFLWIDLQTGIGVGGIFFRPSNGEPTPTLTLFARQVRTKTALRMSQLPAAFAADLAAWQRRAHVPRLSPRYFIGGNGYKVVLEHRADYCAPGPDGEVSPRLCRQESADAADMDLNAAYYLEQTHHATNATARMIFGSEQLAWFGLRDRRCSAAADALVCRARFTRERIRVITHRAPRSGHPRG